MSSTIKLHYKNQTQTCSEQTACADFYIPIRESQCDFRAVKSFF
jgi:hypothetical protein